MKVLIDTNVVLETMILLVYQVSASKSSELKA